MAMLDTQMLYIAVSERWLTDFSLDHSPVGLSHYDVLPEISERWRTVCHRCLAGAAESSDGEPIQDARGRVQMVKWSAWPWRDIDRAVGGVILTMEDITERSKPEADIEAAHLASVVIHSSDAIIAKGLDSIVTNWNAGATRLLGYRAEEMIGQSIARIIPADRPGEEDQILECLRAGGDIENFETKRVAKDGRTLDVSLSISPVKNALGAIVGASKIMRDITAQVRVQRDLASTAAILEAVYESSPDGILVVDPMGRILSVNRRFHEMFGVPAELTPGSEPEPLLVLSLLSVEDPEAFRSRVLYLRGHSDESAQDELVLKDGRVFDRSTSPLKAPDGEWLGRIWCLRDITEGRKAEETLRASEERFRALVEEAPDAILLFDGDRDRLIAANKAAERLYGVPREELCRQGPLPFYPAEQPDARPATLSFAEYKQRALAGGELTFKRRLRRPTGEERLCRVTLVRLPSDARLFRASLVDITDEDRAQRNLASAAAILAAEHESSPDAILVVDPLAKIISCNSRFREMFDIPDKLIVSGDNDYIRVMVRQRLLNSEGFDRRVRYLYEHPEESGHDEIVFKDGRVIDRLTSPFKTSDGEYLGRIWFFRDISERRKAEESLRASEERFRLLVEEAPDAILLYDADQNRVASANRAAERLFGVSRDEILEYGPTHFYTPEQPDRRLVAESFPEYLERALAGEEVTYERRIRRPSGEERLCRATLVRLLANVRLVRASFVDVTERRRAELSALESEAALLQSQKRLRHAVDAGRLTYAEFDLRADLARASENYAGVMGYAPLHADGVLDVNAALSRLVAHVAPEDRVGVGEKIRSALSGEFATVEAEFRVVGDDGATRWIRSVGQADLGANGLLERIFVTNLDVTQQIEAREALRRAQRKADDILSSIADGFYALDDDWRFVYFNGRAEQITNNKREEVLGRRIFEVFPEAEDSEIHKVYRQVMMERAPIQFETFAPVTKRWTFLAVYPTAEGGISVYFRDISEQKRAASEVAAAKVEAERANQAKSKFLAAASHDLRQPVQSLVLLMALAERQIEANPQALETLGKMQGSLEGLNALLGAILDVSRLDAGIEAQVESVDLAVLISRLAFEYGPKAEQRGLVLRTLPRALWAHADPALLERALRNLIENALRYTPAGGVVIGLRRRGERIRIDVIDTGIGIPEGRRKDIFEEFVQLKNPGRQLGLGLGLGLAIVERIARLIDATIEVRSTEGKGSRFSLTLPAIGIGPAIGDENAEEVQDPGGRVLIVEDNQIVREGLEALLTLWGYETIVASDGEHALDVAEREGWRFGCVVTDQRLGAGLTGVETAKEILRRSGRDLPTLVLTGDTARENIAEIIASGFEVMHKPIASEIFRRALARMMSA